MTAQEPDTDQLLTLASEGDRAAQQRLLTRHRKRLRQMIALRMDRRLAARVDPSDVVQETLAKAAEQLSDYLRRRPLPFYPWLRQMALERLAQMHRHHVRVRKRSVQREEHRAGGLSDASLQELAVQLVARGSSPSARLRREELHARLHAALAQLPEPDREILALRHLEQLSVKEIAAVLGIKEGAVYARHLRALERLRQHLGDISLEEES
jgi:RNA polymerase sigma-70 factor (ECF subfamily)